MTVLISSLAYAINKLMCLLQTELVGCFISAPFKSVKARRFFTQSLQKYRELWHSKYLHAFARCARKLILVLLCGFSPKQNSLKAKWK